MSLSLCVPPPHTAGDLFRRRETAIGFHMVLLSPGRAVAAYPVDGRLVCDDQVRALKPRFGAEWLFRTSGRALFGAEWRFLRRLGQLG